MTRLNVAYLVSDEWDPRMRSHPSDHYLRIASAFLETYYALPLGNYSVVYVNTLRDIVDDLSHRLRQNNDKVGNMLVVVHGALNRRAAEGQQNRINLPIEGPIAAPLTSQELRNQLVNLGDTLDINTRTRRALEILRGKRFDAESSLVFMGCFFGKERGMLDAFRDFFGGQLTVFAPKEFQGFSMRRIEGGIKQANLDQIVTNLIEMGLLKASPDPLYRALGRETLNTSLLRRLDAVMYPVPNDVVPHSLLDLGYIPVTYLEPWNEQQPRRYPERQEVGRDWGVSQPAGQIRSPAALLNRLRRTLPGALPLVMWVPSTGAEPKQPQRGGLQMPAGTVLGTRTVMGPTQGTWRLNAFLEQQQRAQQAEQRRAQEQRDAQQRERQAALLRQQVQWDVLRDRLQGEAQRQAQEAAGRRQLREQAEAQRERARQEAERRRAQEEAQRRERAEAQTRLARLESQRQQMILTTSRPGSGMMPPIGQQFRVRPPELPLPGGRPRYFHEAGNYFPLHYDYGSGNYYLDLNYTRNPKRPFVLVQDYWKPRR